jgi:indole-3-glycerol phosphate synthase
MAAQILDEIIAHKRAVELPRLPRVDRAKLSELPPALGFRTALQRPAGDAIRVIAECKKGSPSKGIFVENYDPVATAFQYRLGGASCCSVLTDERFFFGHLDHLKAVRAQVDLPLIRKDFIVDERQIAQARLAGADCVLLIAACLTKSQLEDLQGFAWDIGLDVLVEVHDPHEAMMALECGANCIGVNNRNLQTFAVRLETTFDLLPALLGDGRVVVSESGISQRDDCRRFV